MFNYSLDIKDYTWNNAFFWGNFLGHCKKATKGDLGKRVVHMLIAAAECLPIVSQIASIFEKIIVTHFSKSSTPISLPPLAQRKIVRDPSSKALQKEQRTFSQGLSLLNENNLVPSYEQRAIIEKAKLDAQQDGYETSLGIKHYGIDVFTSEGQKGLIEIAKLSAQQDGRATSTFIHFYGINKSTPEGQKALIEIAKLAAQKDGWGTSEHINKYGIDASTLEGQKGLIEIAKLAAQQNGWGTSQHIKNYGIDASTSEGQKGLIQITKLAAQQDGWGTSEHINNYGIDASTSEGQKGLIEIAKLAAKRSGWGTSQHIIMYGIDKSTPEGQNALIEIAKLAAQQSCHGISQFIKNYGIDAATQKGQKAHIEIAKLSAQQNGSTTSHFIQNYDIDASTPEGQKALTEIAKLSAQQSGRNTSQFIRNYGINSSTPEGQIALIEIAKLAAQNDGVGTSEFILYYELDRTSVEGQNSFKDLTCFIFNCIAKQMPSFSEATYLENFSDFKLHCSSVNTYLYFDSNDSKLHLSCESTSIYSLNFDLFKNPFEKLSAGDMQGVLLDGLEICQKHFEMEQSDLLWTFEELKKNKEVFNQKRFLEWFLITASLFSTSKDLIDIFKSQQGFFKVISKQNPHLREALVKEFIHLSYINNTEGLEKLKRASGEVVHVKLACLCLANFPLEGENEYMKVLETLKKERMFKDGKNQKLLLETLINIKECSLDDSQKITLIRNLFNLPENERLQSLRLVSDILAFKGEAYLTHLSSLTELKNSLRELFTQKLQINVHNFDDNYEKTVGSWRKKEALGTYMGRLNELPPIQKEQALDFFRELLTGVLTNSFQQARYKVDKNPHLAEIKSNHKKIFEQWQQEEKLTSEEIAIEMEKKIENIPVAERVIKTLKLALEQQHLGGNKQLELYPALSMCIKNWNTFNESLASIAKELEPLSNRKLIPEEHETKQSLLLQKKILELLQTPEALEKNLTDLKSLIPNTEVFYNDIENSIKMLKTEGMEKPNFYHVIDSDDPNHFLLMGTEVLNSCQNVHGNPELNVCLLGYMLDGKHRLDLVCDDQGNILARSVLRLLIDSKGQPVLFQERVYVADASPAYPKLLRKLALKKAASLGIPLVVSKIDFDLEEAKTYPHTIHAKQKPVPFEYVDALSDGVPKPGPYVIQNALQV